jgi:hypothetical protein
MLQEQMHAFLNIRNIENFRRFVPTGIMHQIDHQLIVADFKMNEAG